MGLPRRHPRRARGGGVPRLRGARLGRRAAHLPARRAARPRDGAALAGARPGAGGGHAGAATREVPEGFLHVFDGLDDRDQVVSLVHEDTPELRRMAVFDAVVNNADRKGGHVLAMTDGHRYGVDHGLTFHVEHKLRTVLWGWAGELLTDEDRAGLRAAAPTGSRATSASGWLDLVTPHEVEATRRRVQAAARGSAPCRSPARAGGPSRGHPSDTRTTSATAAVVSRYARVACSGPACPPRDGASGPRPRHRHRRPRRDPPRRVRPGCTSAGSRRTTRPTWATPRRTSRFDLLNRAWRNAGHDVVYVQNVTDVDDPLLERADEGRRSTGASWPSARPSCSARTWPRCGSLPPAHFVGAVESIAADRRPDRAAAGRRRGLPGRGRPLLLGRRPTRRSATSPAGPASEMLAVFAERGGDPDRPGKKDPLDCLVWRGGAARRAGAGTARSAAAARAGTSSAPRWPWTSSARRFDVQGGGSDLVFPHHEMCASRGPGADRARRSPRPTCTPGMVAYDGEKMSKSQGQPGLRLGAAQQRRRPDGDPADPAAPPLPLRLGVDRRPAVGVRRHRSTAGAARWPSAPVLRPRRWSTPCSPPWPTDLDAPPRSRPVDAWADATLGADGPGRHQRPRGRRDGARPARRRARPRPVDPPSRHEPTRRDPGASVRRLGVIPVPVCADSAVRPLRRAASGSARTPARSPRRSPRAGRWCRGSPRGRGRSPRRPRPPRRARRHRAPRRGRPRAARRAGCCTSSRSSSWPSRASVAFGHGGCAT